MARVDAQILSFEHGLESVSASQFEAARGPESTELVPWEGDVEARVDKLLQSPSREATLLKELSPTDMNPTVLAPLRFRSLVRAGAREIHDKAAEHDVFARAAVVLAEIGEAHDLLDAYRNALRQV